jgi:predicted esterase
MVWDRVRRGPAVVGNRKLVGLSRDAAERALADLIAAKPVPSSPWLNAPPNWQIVFGHQIIDCSDEHEAKIVARKLTEKGTKVVAQMFSDGQVLRAMEAQDLRAWLSK